MYLAIHWAFEWISCSSSGISFFLLTQYYLSTAIDKYTYTVYTMWFVTLVYNGATIFLYVLLVISFLLHVFGLQSLIIVYKGCKPTCLQSGVIRLRLLVEIFRLMDMPANCRLLFPRILDRALDGGWADQRRTQRDKNKTNHSISVFFQWVYSILHSPLNTEQFVLIIVWDAQVLDTLNTVVNGDFDE